VGRLHQQRHIKNQARAACGLGLLRLSPDFCVNQGVNDGFKLPAGNAVGVNQTTHAVAIQRRLRGDEVSAKVLANRLDGQAPGRSQVA